MLKRILIGLGIAIAIFLVLCWIYLPSISRYRELKSEEDKINKRIQEIDTKIKALTEERVLLQTDIVYLEKVIREELGFVKPGEIIYELVTKKAGKKPVPIPETSANTPVEKIATEIPQAAVSAAQNSTKTISARKSAETIARLESIATAKSRKTTASSRN